MLILTFESYLLGVIISEDICEIFKGFLFLGSFLLCILSVESSYESLMRSLTSRITIDTFVRGASVRWASIHVSSICSLLILGSSV